MKTEETSQNQIIRVKSKLHRLENLDVDYMVFGAGDHEYKLNPKLKESEILAFENAHGITLPPDYRLFLKEMGNGGAGPYYGLWTLEEGIYEFEDTKQFTTDLSQPFPHTASWNIEFGEIKEEDWDDHMKELHETYYISKWGFGLLRLCHFGCAVYLGLVVNGPEKGTIWVDDRSNGNGIYPDPYFDQKDDERTTFLDWYELWLNQGIERMEGIDELTKAIRAGVGAQKEGLELRKDLVLFEKRGGRKYDAYTTMKKIKEQFEKEELVDELMSFINGHCSEELVIWKDE